MVDILRLVVCAFVRLSVCSFMCQLGSLVDSFIGERVGYSVY